MSGRASQGQRDILNMTLINPHLFRSSAGGVVRLRTAEVVIDAGAFDEVHRIQAQVMTETEFDRKMTKSRRKLLYDAVSPFLVLTPEEDLTKEGSEGMKIFINLGEEANGKKLKVRSMLAERSICLKHRH